MSVKTICSLALVSSAASGSVAFLSPAYCGWLVFIFLLPLFYTIGRYNITYTFLHGFVWGIIFFGIQMYGILLVLLERAHGPGRVIVFLFLVFYFSLYAGLWFLCASTMSKYIHGTYYRLCVWVAFTFLFFMFIDRAILLIFGRIEGYPLSWPLLPLAYYPSLLSLLPYLGSAFYFFILLVANCFCIFGIVQRKRFFILGMLCCVPFGYGLFRQYETKKTPDYIQRCATLFPPKYQSSHWLDVAQEITYRLIDCCEQHPEVDIIIMPETTFPFPLNECPEAINLWNKNALMDEKMLLLGAHRKEGKKLYNTLFCIHQGRITQYYDKNLLMPFTEYIPKFLRLFNSEQLFLLNKEQFSGSLDWNTVFSIGDRFTIVPYICSELFFAHKRLRKRNGCLLCIANDSWFSAGYIRRLLYLTAQYKAQEWHQELLYVSHHFARFIDIGGDSYSLQSSK